MIKNLIGLTILAILIAGLVYLLQHVGPLDGNITTILKYLIFGCLGLAALGIVSFTVLGLTAIILGLSFAKGGGFWSNHGGGWGKKIKDAFGNIGTYSSRKVEISADQYEWTSFKIKTVDGELTLTGHDHSGAKATIMLLEKEEGDAEAYFDNGEIKVKSKSGKKAMIGDATVLLPSRLASLFAESVSGDISVHGFVTQSANSFKGVSGDILVSCLKNSSEVSVKTVSGDVKVTESQLKILLAQSISGDVQIGGSAAENAVLKTVSGDIDYSGSDIKNLEVKTVSGTVRNKTAA